MRWRYKLIKKTDSQYIYAYSTDTDDLDGIIIYNISKKKASIDTPSIKDSGSSWAMGRALRHFDTVIAERFPEQRSICCG